jgi:hypothetical protein
MHQEGATVGAIAEALSISKWRVYVYLRDSGLKPHPIIREARPQAERQPGEPKAPRTACIRGHEFTAENAYVRGDGAIDCRECGRQQQRALYQKHLAEQGKVPRKKVSVSEAAALFGQGRTLAEVASILGCHPATVFVKLRKVDISVLCPVEPGTRYGQLEAVSGVRRAKHIGVLCRCECGGERVASKAELEAGLATSCGCAAKGRIARREERIGIAVRARERGDSIRQIARDLDTCRAQVKVLLGIARRRENERAD